ncbi:hypothetical protein BKA82DRAFT_4152234 [Pisolithus tinctorius]|nr:hypothetical protein BKA82DRAFT_4152234 [Pisolithus tinctorius]
MEWVVVFSEFAHDAWQTVIPCPEDRIPLRPRHILHLAAAVLPSVSMAYLARRPKTYHLRLMLLPLIVLVTLGTFFRFIVSGVEHAPANWVIASFAILIVGKVIDCAWRPEGMLKVGEEKLDVFINSSNQSRAQLYDALELICTQRGIGWKFGVRVHVPKEHRSLERCAFLWQTLASALRNFVVIDFCESFIKLVPGVGSPEGGTIFKPELPIPQRYILSTAVHVATGSMFIAGFQSLYDVLTLIGVGLLFNDPSSWPPLLDHPWQSDSLHVFWAKGWHQALRETFFIYGGFIGGAIAGNVGTVFGTFIGSGLLHELAICSHGRGFDPQGMLFFVQQAPLLILEKLWTRVTGHRVRGIYGRLWVYFCIVILGQSLADSWHKRGLGGGYIIDPRISPTHILLIPFLRRFTEFLGLHSIPAPFG